MEAVECTHCGVVMTSWSAPGSPIRYYQCPFCARTHSSLYGEVFRRRAGARVLEGAAASAPAAARAGIPMPSPEDVRWNQVKVTAARWFERLARDERRHEPERASIARAPSRSPAAAARKPLPLRRVAAAAVAEDVPEADPGDVVEIRPAARARKP